MGVHPSKVFSGADSSEPGDKPVPKPVPNISTIQTMEIIATLLGISMVAYIGFLCWKIWRKSNINSPQLPGTTAEVSPAVSSAAGAELVSSAPAIAAEIPGV